MDCGAAGGGRSGAAGGLATGALLRIRNQISHRAFGSIRNDRILRSGLKSCSNSGHMQVLWNNASSFVHPMSIIPNRGRKPGDDPAPCTT
jgi:hypothetical protein